MHLHVNHLIQFSYSCSSQHHVMTEIILVCSKHIIIYENVWKKKKSYLCWLLSKTGSEGSIEVVTSPTINHCRNMKTDTYDHQSLLTDIVQIYFWYNLKFLHSNCLCEAYLLISVYSPSSLWYHKKAGITMATCDSSFWFTSVYIAQQVF